MDSCDQSVYFLSVVLYAWIIFVFAAFIFLRRRELKQVHPSGIFETEVRRTRHESHLQDEPRRELEKDVELKGFTESEENETLRLEDELRKGKEEQKNASKRSTEADEKKLRLEDDLRKEKEEKENALKRFNVAKVDWIKERSRLENELKKEIIEKEDALKRLSAIMSSRLKDGNPNIVDLSDQNRPTKIGEQFSELYDNQWTDAYGVIEIFVGKTKAESEITKILLEILELCFTECNAISRNQLDQISENIATIIAKKQSSLLADLMQRIKEERKMFAYNKVPELSVILPMLKSKFSPKYQDQNFLEEQCVKEYVQECLKISWLMVIQDPPMAMVIKPQRDIHENFRAYKTRGKHLEYIVWPALFLEKGGTMVMKGVAEFTSVSP